MTAKTKPKVVENVCHLEAQGGDMGDKPSHKCIQQRAKTLQRKASGKLKKAIMCNNDLNEVYEGDIIFTFPCGYCT